MTLSTLKHNLTEGYLHSHTLTRYLLHQLHTSYTYDGNSTAPLVYYSCFSVRRYDTLGPCDILLMILLLVHPSTSLYTSSYNTTPLL